MQEIKNKISTTSTTSLFAYAAMSMMFVNTVHNVNNACAPHVLLGEQSREKAIGLDYQSMPSSTRFNNASRYSLEKLRENKKRLRNFKDLQVNWNGYGAEPIPQAVIDKTEEIIVDLDYQPQIFPTGRGTIQIEYFKDDDNLIEAEVSAEEIYVYKEENGDDFEGVVELNTLSEIITAFYA